MFNASADRVSPGLLLAKLVDQKEAKGKSHANSLSIEKRAPINIFNIKNVNYLNTEPHDTSQSIFHNDILKEKKVFLHDRRSTKASKDRHDRAKSFSSTLANARHSGLASQPIHPRKRSLDSKCLVEMMAKVNQLKASPIGAKILFQKIVRNFEHSEPAVETSGLETLIKHVRSTRKRASLVKNATGKMVIESSESKIEHEITLEVDAEERAVLAKTKALALEISSLMDSFRQFSFDTSDRKKAFLNKETQTTSKNPLPLSLTNFNTPALIKEFSRAFMLTKRVVNNTNETGSEYLRRINQVVNMQDEQTVAIFKDIFCLEQEHVLVEESLKMIQDKGYDLEALFGEGYHKLGITGQSQKPPTHRSDDANRFEDVSSVSFESHHLPEFEREIGKLTVPRDTNCFFLDFDRLDRSSE